MKNSFYKKIHIKTIPASLIFGFLTGFIISAGGVLDKTDAIELLNPSLWVSALIWGIFFTILSFVLWIVFDFIIDKANPDKKKLNIPLPVCAAVMFVSWIPYWLSIFPGVFSYDAYDEWKMVADGVYTTHHPLIHTVVLGGLTEGFHHITGSYNVGIAVYTALQMILLSTAFSFVIFRLSKIHRSFIMQILLLAYFSLSPIIGLFSIASIKDPLFCAVEMLFFTYVFEFTLDAEKFVLDRKNVIAVAFFGLMTMILRKNGLYIVLASDLVILLTCLKFFKKNFKTLLAIATVMFIPYVLYALSGVVLLHAKGGEYQEMLSVPLQQMARVYYFNEDELSAEEIDRLYEYVPKKNLDSYLPTLSDRVKSDFNNEAFKDNPSAFFKLWFSLGKRYPLTYVSSFLINTVDGWYPGAVIDGYRFEDRSSYFDYRVAKPGNEVIIFSKLHETADWISNDLSAQQGIAFLLLFSPGWYFVWFLNFWIYALSRKRKGFATAGSIHVIHFLTVLLGPMALVRYGLNFFYGFPVFIWCLIAEGQVLKLANKKEE